MPRRERNQPWKFRVIAQRRTEAEERQAARDARGDEGQLARLDEMFGKGKGAVRERQRLTLRLAVLGAKAA